MKCKHLGDSISLCEKHGRICRAGCGDYEPARKFKAFGWEVTVEFHDGSQKQFHYRGVTEVGARRNGMLKTLARSIVKVEPFTEEAWITAFGIGRM
jgi:hypothetical protein